MSKQKYCILVWNKEQDLCGAICIDPFKDSSAFIGSKKEAKAIRTYFRDNFEEHSKYKIAKFPIEI